MNDLLNNLYDISAKIRDKETYYWTASDCYYEAKEKVNSFSEEEKTDLVKQVSANIFYWFVLRTSNHLEELAKASINPSLEILNSLRKNLEEISANIDKINQNFPDLFSGNFNCQEVKEMVEAGKKLIKVAREFGLLSAEIDQIDKEDFSWTKMKEFWKKIKQKGSISRENKFLSEVSEAFEKRFLFDFVEICWEFVQEVKIQEAKIFLLTLFLQIVKN